MGDMMMRVSAITLGFSQGCTAVVPAMRFSPQRLYTCSADQPDARMVCDRRAGLRLVVRSLQDLGPWPMHHAGSQPIDVDMMMVPLSCRSVSLQDMLCGTEQMLITCSSLDLIAPECLSLHCLYLSASACTVPECLSLHCT
ncbi:hypothetical protein COO60DRAFT_616768 [Scenedesmus sp. NREL 46B-D3]|nr:hypothetical protein COO60DRAFT_616768 [Scenedesmus sp. NREL 46B-D3]